MPSYFPLPAAIGRFNALNQLVAIGYATVCPDTDGDNRALRGRGKRGARLRLRRPRVRGLLHDLDGPWADVGVPSGINHCRFKLDRDQECGHTLPFRAVGRSLGVRSAAPAVVNNREVYLDGSYGIPGAYTRVKDLSI